MSFSSILGEEEPTISDTSTCVLHSKLSCLLWVPELSIKPSLEYLASLPPHLCFSLRLYLSSNLSHPKNPYPECILCSISRHCQLLSLGLHVSMTSYTLYNLTLPGLTSVNQRLRWMKKPGTDATWVNLFQKNRRESVPLGDVARPGPFPRIDTGQASGMQLLTTKSVDEGQSH